jgi:hypothetical protein
MAFVSSPLTENSHKPNNINFMDNDKNVWWSIRKKAIAYGKRSLEWNAKTNSLPPLYFTDSMNLKQIALSSESDNSSKKSA